MTMTYKPEYYIKGLNIHSVRDLFLPARVSADLDLTFRRHSKKSRLSKKALKKRNDPQAGVIRLFFS